MGDKNATGGLKVGTSTGLTCPHEGVLGERKDDELRRGRRYGRRSRLMGRLMGGSDRLPYLGVRALLRVALVVLGCGGLSACVLTPGTHMEDQRSGEEGSRSLESMIDVVPITPELIGAYERRRGKAQKMTPAQRREIENYEYRVGPGDVLSVIVFDHPELTIPAGGERSAADAGHLVRRDGTIFFPFIDSVHVAGRTTGEIRGDVTERLAEFISDPQVDVRVARHTAKRAFVTGAVRQPAVIPLTDAALTVLDAIATAGLGQDRIGGGQEPNLRGAKLIRDGEAISVDLFGLLRQGDLTQNYVLRDGDILHIPPSVDQLVSVLGEVGNPVTFQMGEERLSLTDAIGRAGGLDRRTASPTGVFVLRPLRDDPEKIATVYQLNLTRATGLMLGARFQLSAHDVVFVTASPLDRWNRVINLLVPSLDFVNDIPR